MSEPISAGHPRMTACPGVNKDGKLCPFTAKCSRFKAVIIKSIDTHFEFAPVRFINERVFCSYKIDKSTEL